MMITIKSAVCHAIDQLCQFIVIMLAALMLVIMLMGLAAYHYGHFRYEQAEYACEVVGYSITDIESACGRRQRIVLDL
jgi:hypothetical protein